MPGESWPRLCEPETCAEQENIRLGNPAPRSADSAVANTLCVEDPALHDYMAKTVRLGRKEETPIHGY